MKTSLFLSAVVLGAATLAFSSSALADKYYVTDPITGVVVGVGNIVTGAAHGVAYGTGKVLTGAGHVVHGVAYDTGHVAHRVSHTNYKHARTHRYNW